MSWLGDLIGGLFQNRQAKKQREWNANQAELNRQFQSDEAAINREFQSSEAALQRSWSAAEAERAMDWNEEMYAKYNSLSGKIAQANNAGVNPMVAITGNAVSPMSTGASAPSGSSAGSVGTPSGATATSQFVDLVATFMGLRKLKSEVAVNDSIAQKNLSEASHTGWLSKLSEREYNIITEHNFDVQMLESKIGLNNEQANQAFQLAGRAFEEAGKIAEEKRFMVDTSDDREKIVEYDKIMKEFESSLPSVLGSLDNNTEISLSQAVGAIIKALLYIKK